VPTPPTQFKYLRPEDIRRLQSFEFAPSIFVEGYLSGRHRSHHRGSSIEFHDYRQYVPGDDLALVDWRVFARTDRHFLRTFEQETNMECHIFLDSSASMGFEHNGLAKLDYASFFAAALAYLVTRNGDRVSLQIFDDKIRHFAPPGSTRQHLQTIMHLLEDNRPGNHTSVATALKRSHPLLKRRGTLVVISDFFDDVPAIFNALSPYLHRGFRIHLFHIITPQELNLNIQGLHTFIDMETGERVVAHADQIKDSYQKAMQEHIQHLRAYAVRRRVDYCVASLDTNYYQLFDHFTK
jgi:uncharacterized protein (DUF58 family)